MKSLLLFCVLLWSYSVQGQTWKSWAGKLPVNAENKLIAYRGRVVVPGASAATLQHCAEKYMVEVAHMEPAYAAADGPVAFIGFGHEGDINYELVISSAQGGYSYMLVHFEYVARSGEAFAEEGITPLYERIPVEEILRQEKQQATAGWQEWQTKITTAAKLIIEQMQAAMKQ
ncbi:hypothetical protein Q5H92_26565 [Hymenobacter sp. M29]|uniref:DUF4468 domain-containing protein n=1 Tax=Hymenobacter mellowenesis TaxID=3063995 RepID=A0ABT9AL45_9BACT|nr:hypothetical protein [Hymenobacter sp. M29]MDO7849951.1 hypothetical protein [Hymenobacter sp. M29]